MKKEFTVMMPFTGMAIKVVEAETEKEAIDIFLNESTFPSFKKTSVGDVDIEEIDFCEQIVKGNVFYGIQNTVDVQEN